MKCVNCPSQAEPARTRCARCLAKARAYRRAHTLARVTPALPRADHAAEYPCQRLAYDAREWQAAYDSTPAHGWALLFWQSLSIRLGRPFGGVYRHARRLGQAAKVDARLR